jgi:ketosteroid isomerase-like protein
MAEERSTTEFVRDFYDAVNAWLVAYWADPTQDLTRAPGVEEVFDYLTQDAEWNWVFTADTLVGREQWLGAAKDFAETVSDWRLEPDEIVEAGDNRILVRLHVVAQGTGSGTPINQQMFSVITLRDGKVARVDDLTDPAEARKQAGLRE